MKISPQRNQMGWREHLKKRRVYQEEAKTRQTSHWDWDYLPLSELERLVGQGKSTTTAPSDSGRSRRIKTALACIAAGILLMAALLGYILVDLRPV